MHDKRNQLLDYATALFSRYGLISVTMDDLARTAGVSKKTVYQYYSNKSVLVEIVVDHLIEQFKHLAGSLAFSSFDVVQELVLQQKIFERLIGLRVIFNAITLKRFPKALKAFNDFKTDYLDAVIKKNLLTGVAKGYYLPNLNLQSTATIYISLADCFVLNNLKNQAEVFEVLLLFINGITTADGRILVKKHRMLFNYTAYPQI